MLEVLQKGKREKQSDKNKQIGRESESNLNIPKWLK